MTDLLVSYSDVIKILEDFKEYEPITDVLTEVIDRVSDLPVTHVIGPVKPDTKIEISDKKEMTREEANEIIENCHAGIVDLDAGIIDGWFSSQQLKAIAMVVQTMEDGRSD